MFVEKKTLRQIVFHECSVMAKTLTVQWRFLELLEETKSLTWTSYICAPRKGIMVWAIRASTDSLATLTNLAKWKKIVDPMRKLYSNTDKK